MTAIAAALTEAWGQVRVHRARVVLSLLGVFLAVLTMTAAAAVGRIGQQMISESFESIGGRSATIQVVAYTASDGPQSAKTVQKAYDDFVKRHKVAYSSTVTQSQVVVATGGPAQSVDLLTVDPAYGLIHRITPLHGRWFTEADTGRLSPAVVVNEQMAELLGGIADDQPRTVQVVTDGALRLATVIGVVHSTGTTMPQMISVDPLGSATPMGGPPSLELWVPPGDASAVQELARTEIAAAVQGAQADAFRMDGGDTSEAIDGVLTTAITWVGLLLLGLGALGVVNVAIVTVRQRVREIGIRRSFGASSGRVFTTVMLETALATALAGVLAVAVAVAIVPRLPINEWVGEGLGVSEMPAFPIEVALGGVVAATALGLLAGLIPAIIAVRANPVEAIRF